MHHLDALLNSNGFDTLYIETSPAHTSMDQLATILHQHHINAVSYYDLVDNWLEQRLAAVVGTRSVTTIDSPGFLTSSQQIKDYFDHNPNRMQQFYEWQRKRLNILIAPDGTPVGGKWSFDESNRKKLPASIQLPPKYQLEPDPLVAEAASWVQSAFANNPGSIDFRYPTTHAGASLWLDQFIAQRLSLFGPYEDAISTSETELFHSILSPLINIGLLTPQQVVDRVLQQADDTVTIESLEGFVRQVIGWREYMRATYVTFGSTMRSKNHLNHKNKLPRSWWDGTVGLAPVDTVIKNVLDTAYAHHIERLMILGNAIALLRIDPDDVHTWFMELFIDAYDWVMVPNVYAMSQFAAGNMITTKPYVSGSNYIIKMSDYKKGDWSDTWDALYWQFVADNRELLSRNFRVAMIVQLYDNFTPEKKESIRQLSAPYIDRG